MPAEIKFCGMTRQADALEAATLGAGYVGAIFASGPRRIDAARAAQCFRALPRDVRRVGVFGAQSPDEIAATAHTAGLDIAQLHGDPDASAVDRVRQRTGLLVWAVVRIEGTQLPPHVAELLACANAVVLDAKVAGALGGTGRPLRWTALADALAPMRGGAPIVLAGGLTPDNVGRAIAALGPEVVDVSSGVERAPGIKDHARMRAFADAVRHAGANR